jgi:hypothetical protein
MVLDTILLIIALILLILAAFGVSHPRVSLGWLGMAFFVASLMV